MNTTTWVLLLISQVFARGLNTIFIQLSKIDSVLKYSVSGMACVVEAIKLLFSLASFFALKLRYEQRIANSKKSDAQFQFNQQEHALYTFSLTKESAIYYLIPAFLYFIGNNLYVYLMDYMDPITNQILGLLDLPSLHAH
jgi:hypothetical protein